MATDTEAAGGVPSILRPLADDLAARRAYGQVIERLRRRAATG
jgi:hypothetical protein